MSKNKFQKKLKFSIISFFSLLIMISVFSVSSALACNNDGNLDPGESCDGTAFIGVPTGTTARCAHLGDTDPITSIKLLTCNTDCTINDTLCSGGFGSPSAPANVPTNFEDAVLNLTDWILGFISMIAVLAIVWGGLMYIASAGDEAKATTGKRIVTYALIGLVIAGIAFALVNVLVTVIF